MINDGDKNNTDKSSLLIRGGIALCSGFIALQIVNFVFWGRNFPIWYLVLDILFSLSAAGIVMLITYYANRKHKKQ
jgi:ABC-type antimicrobial peptide transport system permease subunit